VTAYRFVQAEKAFPIATMCEVLGVSRSGFYDWRGRTPSDRVRSDRTLRAHVRAAHAASHGTYGSPRIHAELHEQGLRVSRKRIARLMHEDDLCGRPRKKWKRTTDSAHQLPVAPNLLNRDFETEAPNLVWAADLTYIPTAEGWLYLAVVIDLYARKVVGWAAAGHMRTELCLEALDKALVLRSPKRGFIHHSDRGSQYASNAYQQRLRAAGARCSMSRKGDCWDNAVVESFFGSLKQELARDTLWPTKRAAKAAINDYILKFYNPVRRHSANGHISPNVHEKHYQQAA
jgi:putative transposase